MDKREFIYCISCGNLSNRDNFIQDISGIFWCKECWSWQQEKLNKKYNDKYKGKYANF